MNELLIGLQFLTRIRLVKQTEWSPENFGRSVKYFPIVGAVIGSILAGIAYLGMIYFPSVFGMHFPAHFGVVILLLLSILLTGGLHCDGFMDTMDGVFSGRSRERMLEIMKDSCVGANGVVAFAVLLLAKWSLLFDLKLDANHLIIALFVMPIISRMAMVMGITLFPYARPEGIGKAFAQYANKKSLWIAAISTLLFVVPCGFSAIISMIGVGVFTPIFCRYITSVLGGLTGDVYGALTELSEILVLILFLITI